MMSISEPLQNQDNAAILIVNCDRKIVGFTPNLLRIWNLPEVIIKSLSDQRALEFVSEGLDNPKLFLKDMTEIYEQTHLEINEKVNSRTVASYSAIPSPYASMEFMLVGCGGLNAISLID